MDHYKLECFEDLEGILNLFKFGLRLEDILCPTCFKDYQYVKDNDYDIDLFRTEREISHRFEKSRKVKKPAQEPIQEPAEIIPEHKSVYELTLTTTKDDPYELRAYLNKIVRSRMFGVVKWKACYELTEAGMPHIHAILYSENKYCDATKIKALKFPYRYELKPVRSLHGFNNYILKEKNNPIVIEYCAKKGIPQIFDA